MRLSPLLKTSLKYGLTGSVLAMALILALFYTGTHPLLIFILFDFRILLFGIFVFFSIKEYKDYFNGGLLQFWQGLTIGFVTYTTIGLVAALFIIIFAEINPDFMHQYVSGTIDGLMANKENLVNDTNISITQEEFDYQIELLKQTKPYELGIDYFIKSCVIGFFIVLLLAVILRKSESRFSNRVE